MRSVRVLRNIVTNHVRFFVTGALSLVLTPIMVHALGDGGYGLWVAIFSLTGYFGLFDQGIRPSLVRYVSRDHARGDKAGLSRTLSSAFALYGAAGLVTMAFTAIAAAGFPHWFRIAPEQIESARATVLLAGASIALGLPFGVFGAALSGLQRYDVANAIGTAITIARVVAFVGVLRLGGGLVGLAWASLVMNVTGHAISWACARRLMPGVRIGPSFVTREHLGSVASYGGIAFVGAIANSVTFQTDALVITAFLGAAFVTPFALAAGLIDNVRSLVHSATFVLSPTASELETRGEGAKLHDMMIAGAKYSVLLAWPVLFGLLVFGENLLVTWVGPQYAPAARLLAILAIPTLLSLPQAAAASVLFGVSRHRGVVVLALLNALLNLALSILWVRPFGLAGVAMGTAVPLALVGGVAMIVYGCRVLGLPLGRYLWEGLGRPGIACLVFLFPALALQHFLRPVGWVPLLAVTAGCWLTFAWCAWRFGLGPGERARWERVVPGLFRAGNAAAA